MVHDLELTPELVVVAGAAAGAVYKNCNPDLSMCMCMHVLTVLRGYHSKDWSKRSSPSTSLSCYDADVSPKRTQCVHC